MNTSQRDPQAAVFIERTNRFIAASEFLRGVEDFIILKSMRMAAQNPLDLDPVHAWITATRVYVNEAFKAMLHFERSQEVVHLETAEKLINLIKE